MEDKQLIKGCLQGDMDDFKKIINKYRGKAMALALNILRNREDAEDACQDAFVKIYHSLGKFDMSQSFSSWFYSIIYNQCLDYVRKKSRYYKLLNRIKREPLPVSNKEKTFSSEKLHSSLGFSGSVLSRGWQVVRPEAGQALGEVQHLFAKLDESVIDEETARLGT